MSCEIDTGPFCRHFNDPGYCDIECLHCGHRCVAHDIETGECDECDCPGWEDEE